MANLRNSTVRSFMQNNMSEVLMNSTVRSLNHTNTSMSEFLIVPIDKSYGHNLEVKSNSLP